MEWNIEEKDEIYFYLFGFIDMSLYLYIMDI